MNHKIETETQLIKFMFIENQFVKGKGFFGMIAEIFHQHETAHVRVYNGIKWISRIKSLSTLTPIGMEEFSQRCHKRGITSHP